jgi:hypothetical protein
MTKEEELDLAALTVEPAKLLPVPKGKSAAPNPLADHLEQSWDEPKSVKVPASQAHSVESKLRKTAMRMGYGVAVQFQVLPENDYISGAKVRELDPVEKIRVVFQIHEKYKAARHETDEDD